MYTILSFAIAITLATSAFICIKWRNLTCTGPTPLSLLAFSAILFTSGLDVGLIMFPLVEFPVYAARRNIALPTRWLLSLASGAFLVWAFYFLTHLLFLYC